MPISFIQKPKYDYMTFPEQSKETKYFFPLENAIMLDTPVISYTLYFTQISEITDVEIHKNRKRLSY